MTRIHLPRSTASAATTIPRARAARSPIGRRPGARWALVRLVAPADTGALIRFGQRCSRDSLFHRFISPMTALPTAHIDDVVAGRGDLVSSVAVLPDGSIVGLATLAPSRSGPPELAVLVEDRWQRRGVGRVLVRDLVGRARALGFTQLAVVVESIRPGLVQALAPIGPSRHRLDGPTIEAVFELS